MRGFYSNFTPKNKFFCFLTGAPTARRCGAILFSELGMQIWSATFN
jgi:hypothetical protein